MTKQVLVKIDGRQLQADEPITMAAEGVYHFTNGKHFIQYDEKVEEKDTVIKNMIKIGSTKVVLSKKLSKPFEMEFDLNDMTTVTYQTPFGNLVFDIKTYSILLKEEPDKLELYLEYSLTSEKEPVSDNTITITVTSM